MFESIKVLSVELSDPILPISGLERYRQVWALVRLHGRPLGFLRVPVRGDRCLPEDLYRALGDELLPHLGAGLLREWLDSPVKMERNIFTSLDGFDVTLEEPGIGITVVVCTRNRTTFLADCLNDLLQVEYSNLEILVVDNAPDDNSTRELVESHFPKARYICESHPGLDWARNRAIEEASGEIIAFTDDDVSVDTGWVKAIASVFAENPHVMAVTGLVAPYELETEAQYLFELYGGFGRGCQRQWFRVPQGQSAAALYGGTGRFGTGANMAYRRTVFSEIGLFDPALDVGTVTNGGGDLEMFFRVLKAGHTLVYEPRALVWHRHRRDYEQLRRQLTNNGIGFYAYLHRSARVFTDERTAMVLLGLWWFWYWSLRRLFNALTRPVRMPLDLIMAELVGSLVGLKRYPRAWAEAKRMDRDSRDRILQVNPGGLDGEFRPGSGIHQIDLESLPHTLEGAAAYGSVRVYVSWGGLLIGDILIENQFAPVNLPQLQDEITAQLGDTLLPTERQTELADMVLTHWQLTKGSASESSSPARMVSVVIATYDRPADLGSCLQSLIQQDTSHPVEIIVVDNHPVSQVTPPVVAEYPGVILIDEPRQGLSIARNAGIRHCRGEIIVMTDDDIIAPPGYLERLVAQFDRNDVMAVTGNVLPYELETPAQRLFENYGGLGRGYERKEVASDWFEMYRRKAVPTWTLGATANAAFRADIFHRPEVGLLNEALGAGTPTGCSEDTYLFYRILKNGGTLIYEPGAFVWHKHRRKMESLRRQIFNYSKGHVAYHLITLFKDGDLRALVRLGVELPLTYFWRTVSRLIGKSSYPIRWLLLEAVGNSLGPWALLRSQLRARRLRRTSQAVVGLPRSHGKQNDNAV